MFIISRRTDGFDDEPQGKAWRFCSGGSLAALLEDSVGSSSSSSLDLFQHHHPGELPKHSLCLFVIGTFTGLIRQTLTLVLSHIPAPGGSRTSSTYPRQAPISPKNAKTRVVPKASGNLMP